MKPKLILCLALVLCGCFYSQNARAFWMTIALNRTNIVTTAPFLRIDSTPFGLTNNPVVAFSVFVLLKDKDEAELLSGSLTVKDDEDAKPYLVETRVEAEDLPDGIVPTAIPKSWAGKCKVFRFAIAARLLGHSDFCVNFATRYGGTGDAYDFNLKEFADEK
jgi:hypothetical protein